MQRIPYVEIRYPNTNNNANALLPFALIEPSECWFEICYYTYGEFELYCVANAVNLNALKKGNYVTLPNKAFIWVITSVEYTFTAGGSRMISARGYEAKWLLSKRINMSPWQITTLGAGVTGMINKAMGSTANSVRKIANFVVEENINATPVNMQVTRGNLLETVANLLKTYKLGYTIILQNNQLVFQIIEGRDLSSSVRFSQALDNLLSSTYSTNDEDARTYCQIVSTFTENDVSTDYVEEYDQGATGVERSELTIQSNLSTKYTDENGVEQETTPTSDLYKSWQQTEGQNELAEHITVEEVAGELDTTNSIYVFGQDYTVGDLVNVQDEYFDINFNTRITKVTLSLDTKGNLQQQLEYSND